MNDGVKYCPECGKQVGEGAVMCPSCGHMFGNKSNAGGTVAKESVLSEGLMMIFIGLLIELASPAFGFSGAGSLPGAIGAFIGVGGLIVELIGFSKIRHFNPHFQKTWNYYIGAIACSVGYAIVSIIITFSVIGATLTGLYGIVIAMLVISICFTIALGILDILRIKELMEGCSDINMSAGDNSRAEKCRFAGRFYTITRGIALGITTLVLILTLAFYGSAMSGGYGSSIGLLTAIGVFGIILIIILCVQLAAQILVIVRLYQTYSMCKAGGYDGTGTSEGQYYNPGNASARREAPKAEEKQPDSSKSVHERVEELEKKLSAAPAKPDPEAKKSEVKTEDPVTMLKRPDVELEFVHGKGASGADDDEERTVLLTGEASALINTATGEKIQITSDTFTLGRSREKVDYRIENPAVSITHAKISKAGGKVFIEDLNSSNHTYVNGALLQPGETSRVELKDGDTVKLAEVEFKWEEGAPAPVNKPGGDAGNGSVFVVRIDKTGEEEAIKKTEITLGRKGGNADIKVGDSNTVGRLHARIRSDEESGRLFLKDEDSANGTFINGKRLEKGEEVEIKDNDDIMLSDSTVKFRVR